MIKSRNIGSLYLFYGPENYLKRNYTEQMEKTILAEDFRLLNKVTLEGKVAPAAIIDNCETLPAFSDRRLIVVKNSGLFKGTRKRSGADTAGVTEDAATNDTISGAGEGSAGSTEKKAGDRRKRMTSGDELADFLQNVPPHACLVFIEEEIDRRTKYVKLIEKYGLIVEFNFRMPDELTKWVMKRIKELGHETNPRAAALIVDYCEPGMDDILNEIKKLCSFAGSRRV
jgi:DNA polymerase-3 subunit delta